MVPEAADVLSRDPLRTGAGGDQCDDWVHGVKRFDGGQFFNEL
jgi:hypothetical protein